jgi:hypothetical protein
VWHAQKAKNRLHRELPSPDFGTQKESGADQADHCLYKQPDNEQDVFHLAIVSGIPMLCKVIHVRDIFRHHQKGKSAIPVVRLSNKGHYNNTAILYELLQSGMANLNLALQGGISSAFTFA